MRLSRFRSILEKWSNVHGLCRRKCNQSEWVKLRKSMPGSSHFVDSMHCSKNGYEGNVNRAPFLIDRIIWMFIYYLILLTQNTTSTHLRALMFQVTSEFTVKEGLRAAISSVTIRTLSCLWKCKAASGTFAFQSAANCKDDITQCFWLNNSIAIRRCFHGQAIFTFSFNFEILLPSIANHHGAWARAVAAPLKKVTNKIRLWCKQLV